MIIVLVIILLILAGYWLVFRGAPTGQEIDGVGFVRGNVYDSKAAEEE